MRIGVDGACWANRRGYGRFTRELFRALVPLSPNDEFVIFVDARARATFDLAERPNVRVVEVPQRASPTQAAAADGYRAPADLLRFTRAVQRARPDVFFSPSVYTYFPLPPWVPAVVAIHDTIAERHPSLTLPSRRARLFWRAKVKLALLQARLVVTVSEFSARELEAALGVPRRRVRIVGEAPAATFHPVDAVEIAAAAGRAGLGHEHRWLAYVGGFGPHKHVDAIVRAHGVVARRAGAPLHLLLVGAVDDVFLTDRASIDAAIDRAGTAHLVHWMGYLPDGELRPLLAGATALVLPSEREGFGLPAVEAAACGTPVVATERSPLPALLDGGGLFVEPGDEHALASALTRLVTDPELRRSMGERARARAGALTWSRAAGDALDAIREASR